MKINIEIPEASSGKFSNIIFSYNDLDETRRKVPLKIFDFLNLHDFSNDTTSCSFDFFFISSLIYGIDDLLNRKIYSIDGWAREIEVELPVNNLDLWNSALETLEETLCFLTGDYWSLSFSQLDIQRIFKTKPKRWKKNIPQYNKTEYQFISLFSGGLDSLIGVIDYFEKLDDEKKILLVSHSDPAYPGARSDQNDILKKFEKHFQNKYDSIRCRVGLSSLDNIGEKINRDSNQRSRSILFIGIGVYLASTIPGISNLIIPENGTISLNHPLTPSRSTSLSTRTTHPHFLYKVQKLFSLLNIDIGIYNPYSLKTKGMMVYECINKTVLEDVYLDSASCGKRGHKTYWHDRSAKQCGTCMPCIYRRASLHKLNWDNENNGKDLLNLADPEKGSPDMAAFLDYLKTPLSKEQIKRNLMVNGSLPLSQLDDFADVVINSRIEIFKWIQDKGNNTIKEVLGIR